MKYLKCNNANDIISKINGIRSLDTKSMLFTSKVKVTSATGKHRVELNLLILVDIVMTDRNI